MKFTVTIDIPPDATWPDGSDGFLAYLQGHDQDKQRSLVREVVGRLLYGVGFMVENIKPQEELDGPVTAERLIAIGFVIDGDTLLLTGEKNSVQTFPTGGWMVADYLSLHEWVIIPAPKTMGDVITLCGLLGIPTKEQP